MDMVLSGVTDSHPVRSEYEETEQATLLVNSDHFSLFLVTGQPEIGPLPSLSIIITRITEHLVREICILYLAAHAPVHAPPCLLKPETF